jgi:hypothetical protein
MAREDASVTRRLTRQPSQTLAIAVFNASCSKVAREPARRFHRSDALSSRHETLDLLRRSWRESRRRFARPSADRMSHFCDKVAKEDPAVPSLKCGTREAWAAGEER